MITLFSNKTIRNRCLSELFAFFQVPFPVVWSSVTSHMLLSSVGRARGHRRRGPPWRRGAARSSCGPSWESKYRRVWEG